jgi:hypothetical protein
VRLDENEEILLQVYELLTDAAKNHHHHTAPAAVWLLDNFYKIEEQIRTARRHLPKSYSRQHPLFMEGLERFRGHFYNWYDIKLMRPLCPLYISTVDGGNLAGHLIILSREAPLPLWSWTGWLRRTWRFIWRMIGRSTLRR